MDKNLQEVSHHMQENSSESGFKRNDTTSCETTNRDSIKFKGNIKTKLNEEEESTLNLNYHAMSNDEHNLLNTGSTLIQSTIDLNDTYDEVNVNQGHSLIEVDWNFVPFSEEEKDENKNTVLRKDRTSSNSIIDKSQAQNCENRALPHLEINCNNPLQSPSTINIQMRRTENNSNLSILQANSSKTDKFEFEAENADENIEPLVSINIVSPSERVEPASIVQIDSEQKNALAPIKGQQMPRKLPKELKDNSNGENEIKIEKIEQQMNLLLKSFNKAIRSISKSVNAMHRGPVEAATSNNSCQPPIILNTQGTSEVREKIDLDIPKSDPNGPLKLKFPLCNLPKYRKQEQHSECLNLIVPSLNLASISNNLEKTKYRIPTPRHQISKNHANYGKLRLESDKTLKDTQNKLESYSKSRDKISDTHELCTISPLLKDPLLCRAQNSVDVATSPIIKKKIYCTSVNYDKKADVAIVNSEQQSKLKRFVFTLLSHAHRQFMINTQLPHVVPRSSNLARLADVLSTYDDDPALITSIIQNDKLKFLQQESLFDETKKTLIEDSKRYKQTNSFCKEKQIGLTLGDTYIKDLEAAWLGEEVALHEIKDYNEGVIAKKNDSSSNLNFGEPIRSHKKNWNSYNKKMFEERKSKYFSLHFWQYHPFKNMIRNVSSSKSRYMNESIKKHNRRLVNTQDHNITRDHLYRQLNRQQKMNYHRIGSNDKNIETHSKNSEFGINTGTQTQSSKSVQTPNGFEEQWSEMSIPVGSRKKSKNISLLHIGGS